jgi:hypothetical protein
LSEEKRKEGSYSDRIVRTGNHGSEYDRDKGTQTMVPSFGKVDTKRRRKTTARSPVKKSESTIPESLRLPGA